VFKEVYYHELSLPCNDLFEIIKEVAFGKKIPQGNISYFP
jgi:hypothetical protein